MRKLRLHKDFSIKLDLMYSPFWSGKQKHASLPLLRSLHQTLRRVRMKHDEHYCKTDQCLNNSMPFLYQTDEVITVTYVMSEKDRDASELECRFASFKMKMEPQFLQSSFRHMPFVHDAGWCNLCHNTKLAAGQNY